jgi:energy-coupling factor transport system ATP-binding protein
MALVVLERVRYRYPDATAYALDDITLQIDAGEFVLLAGASGSGKSSLCRLLNGLIPHFHGGSLEGVVRVDGLETREHPVHELFAHVGLVFQNPDAQLFNSTVAREIAFGLESRGLPRDEIRARIEWALDATRTAQLRERAPHSLSGGEQQMVALAAVLALRPRVLVLDEPFANLDPETIARIREILRNVHAQGTTIVLAEHRLHATIQDATRLIVLDHGRVARDGAPRDVLSEDLSDLRLNTPFVVRLARACGWNKVPLSVDEAIAMAQASGCDEWRACPERSRRMASDKEQWRFAPPITRHLPLNGSPVIRLCDVSFVRDGHAVLRNVSLEGARSECVALVGKNGSGKTTLLKHLNALYQPTRGSVVVLNQDTRRARVSDLARQVGLVFQNPNDQLFKPNVREEIEVAPRALDRFDRAWMDKLCDWFGLEPLLERSPFTLSEGEKKRVAFAAALAARPQIVALDEPTTGQDFAFRTALARLLRDLQSEGVTIILATHDLEFAQQVALHWIVLADGEIVADGAPDAVMANDAAMARAALRPTAWFRMQQHGVGATLCSRPSTPLCGQPHRAAPTNPGVRNA